MKNIRKKADGSDVVVHSNLSPVPSAEAVFRPLTPCHRESWFLEEGAKTHRNEYSGNFLNLPLQNLWGFKRITVT